MTRSIRLGVNIDRSRRGGNGVDAWGDVVDNDGCRVLGRAIVQPSLLSLTSVTATPQTRGVVMGTFQSSASVARVVGPVAAGILYDVNVAGPFLLAAALLVVVAWLGRRLDPIHLGAAS